MKKKFIFPYAGSDGRCHDCGVSAGEWHHEGCDVEACPHTFKQRITCDCGQCGEMNLSLPEKVPFGFEEERVRNFAQK